MWSWQNKGTNDPTPKSSLAGGPFKADFQTLTLHPLPTQEFNVRQHYQNLKENHPYYK